MQLSIARVGGRMGSVTIGVTFFAGYHYDPDFDGRVRRLHLRDIIGCAERVGVSIVWLVVRIGLPRAVTFITNFPVFESIIIGDIGMAHPRGGFARRSAAVIYSDKALCADVGGDVNKIGKRSCPGPSV